MRLRSGTEFTPVTLTRILHWQARQANPVSTSVNLEPLIQAAFTLEDERFDQGLSDCEGLGVSPRPLAPLTEYETDTEPESSNHPEHPSGNPGPRSIQIEKKRRNAAANKRRSKKRVKTAASGHQPYVYATSPSTVKHHVNQSDALHAAANAGSFLASGSGSWVGKRKKGAKKTPWTVPELLDEGFKVIEWDGRVTRLILDPEKRVIAVLVGQPDDPEWSKVIDAAAAVMQEVQQLGMGEQLFSDKHLDHRRGEFLAIPVGVSFGGGQTEPGNLVHTKAMRRLIRKILKSSHILRIMGFQSSALAAFAPKLYCYLAQTLADLFGKYPHLVHNFSNSIFPAASFNCGPQTVSLDHTDYNNLSHGLCALTALGSYNHTLGGHLILFNLKLVIQFPAGSTALIPSGCVDHGNTPIRDGEIRLSIAQYAAGGLFRWVAYGFKSAKSLLKTNAGKLLKKLIDKGPGERWREGLAMFSKLDELQADVNEVFV